MRKINLGTYEVTALNAIDPQYGRPEPGVRVTARKVVEEGETPWSLNFSVSALDPLASLQIGTRILVGTDADNDNPMVMMEDAPRIPLSRTAAAGF